MSEPEPAPAPPSPDRDLAAIFPGDGIMAARMRAYDWAAHPLGPPEKWPLSLRTVIRIMLGSRFSMWLGWGPELWFFCNDAYLPTTGKKEHRALGTPAPEFWAEVWEAVRDRAEAVMLRGESTWDERLQLFLERNGYPEESYHTFSYSPVMDDGGTSPVGMLCVVQEETERVIADRRLDFLRGISAALAGEGTEHGVLEALDRCLAADARDIPFALVYLFEPGGARLKRALGMEPGAAAAPEWLSLEDPAPVWDAAAAARGDAPAPRGNLPDGLPRGPWPSPPRLACLVPIPGHDLEGPAGFLVCGLNPLRPWDDDYRGFLELMTAQLGAGLSHARARAAERESAQRHRAVFQQASVGVCECDLDGRFLTVNSALTSMLGYTEEELLTKRWREVTHPDDIGGDEALAARCIAGEIPSYSLEKRYIGKDGVPVWISLFGTVIFDIDGHPLRSVKVVVDISVRKKAEEDLREARSRLESTLVAAEIGTWMWDIRRNIVKADRNLARLFGLAPEEVMEAPIETLLTSIHPEDRPRVRAAIRTALTDTTRDFEEDYRLLRADGTERRVIARGRVRRDVSGVPLYFPGVIIDITERMRMESALRESDLRFRAVFNQASGFCGIIDTGGMLRDGNDTSFALSGHTREAEIGKPFHETSWWAGDPAVSERIRGAVRAALRGDAVRVESPLFLEDGERRWVDLYFTPIRDATGRLAFITAEGRDVTARRAAEAERTALLTREREARERAQELGEEMRETARRLGLALSALDLGDWVWDAATDVMTLSGRTAEIYGVAHGAVFTRSELRLLLSPEDQEKSRAALEESVRTGSDYDIEYPITRPDGARRWISARGRVSTDEDGKVTGMLGVVADITPRKDAEEELVRSGERFRQLADAMPQIVWAATPRGGIDYSNRRWSELTGAGARRGAGISRVLHPDDRRRCLEEWKACVREGRPYQVECRLLFPAEGQYRWVLTRALPVRGENGEIIRWYGTSTDIHDQRQLVDSLHDSRERLASHARRASLLSGMASDLLLADSPRALLPSLFQRLSEELGADYYFNHLLSPEGGLVLENSGGLTPEQHVAFAAIDFAVPEDAESIGPAAAEALRALGARVCVWHPLQAGGRLLGALTLVCTARDGLSEEEVRFMRTVSDLVAVSMERSRLADETSRARDAAERANRAKDDFLATLSHELRTPLNPVLLVASEAAEDLNLPQSVREDFAVIRKNVELEARLIDDLLDITRITRGKLSLERRPLDVHAILRDTLDKVGGDVERKDLDLRLLPRAVNPHTMGDAVRLQQIFWNVLRNAVKFTPDGGVITVETSSDDTGVTVSMRDSGIGMTGAELGRVFDAFSQGLHADGAGAHPFGGLGLGLAISRMLTEMHSGTIHAASAGRGEGSVFTIRLPGAPAPHPGAGEAPGGPDPAVTAVPLRGQGGRRILLVEDHEPTRAALEHLLRRRGYTVSAAPDVACARALADEKEFDLVISDIGLPDGNGHDLMAGLRDRRGLRGIAMTGYGMEHDIVRSRESGFLTHLTKPVSVQSLEAALAAANL